jgi:hypothetical protein
MKKPFHVPDWAKVHEGASNYYLWGDSREAELVGTVLAMTLS